MKPWLAAVVLVLSGCKDDKGESCEESLPDYIGLYRSSAAEWAQVDVGVGTACGVRKDGTIACWGFLEFGLGSWPEGNDFVQVSVGEVHACALHANGRAECWGCEGVWGKGKGYKEIDLAWCVAPEEQFSAIDVGWWSSGGLTLEGEMITWGADWNEVWSGDWDVIDDAPNARYTSLSVGAGFQCGMLVEGALACWGVDWCDTLDVPVGAGPPFAAGYGDACAAIDGGAPRCWGEGGFYLLNSDPLVWMDVQDSSWPKLCGIDDEGDVPCWNSAPQDRDLSRPRASCGSDAAMVTVAAGDAFACGLRANGRIECWGYQNSEEGLSVPRPP